jgi:FkbM family methyltransferase
MNNIKATDWAFKYTYRLNDLLFFSKVTPDWWKLALLKMGMLKGTPIRFGEKTVEFASYGEFNDWWQNAETQSWVVKFLYDVEISRTSGVVKISREGKPFYFQAKTDKEVTSALIYFQNKFIKHQYGWLGRFAKNNTVLDIGATIGDSAIQFATDYKAKKVFAVEPITTFYNIAKTNISLNRLSNKIVPVKFAVGKENKKIRVLQEFVSSDSSALKLSNKGKEVDQYTLESTIKRLGIPKGSVLKLDVFGMEYEVILNAKTEILRHFSAIFIVSYLGYENLERKLRDAGFKVSHRLVRYQYSSDLKQDALISYIMAERTADRGYLFPHSLFATITAPLRRDRFDEVIAPQVGKNYATFYSGRSGVYHILLYLKERYGTSRIHLSKYFLNAGQSVPLVSGEAKYKIMWFDDEPQGVKKGDVVLLTDKYSQRPKGAFLIQDSASNLQSPSKLFDFVIYSFNQDKPMTAAGGGVVVVNNPKYLDFLEVSKTLKHLDGNAEMRCYLDTIKWRIRAYKTVRSLGRMWLRLTKGEEGAKQDAIFRPEGKFHHIDYDMPKLTRKLATDYMPISD